MATVQMVLISGLLGIAACGLVWFGWDLARNLIVSLRAPKLPSAEPDEPPDLDSDAPSEKAQL